MALRRIFLRIFSVSPCSGSSLHKKSGEEEKKNGEKNCQLQSREFFFRKMQKIVLF